MSAAPDEEPEEPDLTAMLDLVLQLVMFFLAVARIDSEQKDQSVVLPQASIARSLTKDYNKLVIINVIPSKDPQNPDAPDRKEGDPVDFVKYSVFEGYFTTEKPNLEALESALKGKFDSDKVGATRQGISDADFAAGKGQSLIVLRAHRNCRFSQVFEVMRRAKKVGYTDAQLRAYLPESKAP